jgi:uncharacterized protein YndB with AHSA1/START domain
MSVTHAGFTIERRYPQTPAQTFSAFAEPELRRRWFANPGNWPDAVWELDFRVGGGEISSGGPAGGAHHAFASRFHDIVDGERIVYAYDLRIDHRLAPVRRVLLEAADRGAALGPRDRRPVATPMQKIVGDALRPEGGRDPEGVRQARVELDRAYALLDAHVGDGGLAGPAFTLADCAAAPAQFYARVVHPWDEARRAR